MVTMTELCNMSEREADMKIGRIANEEVKIVVTGKVNPPESIR